MTHVPVLQTSFILSPNLLFPSRLVWMSCTLECYDNGLQKIRNTSAHPSSSWHTVCIRPGGEILLFWSQVLINDQGEATTVLSEAVQLPPINVDFLGTRSSRISIAFVLRFDGSFHSAMHSFHPSFSLGLTTTVVFGFAFQPALSNLVLTCDFCSSQNKYAAGLCPWCH